MERAVRLYFVVVLLALSACTEQREQAVVVAPRPMASVPDAVDVSKAQVGKASIYSKNLVGRPMASGKPLNASADVVASNSLPLGSTAKVTNLETGKSALVKVEDRGRLPKGRLVDLTPATAKKLGLTRRQGVAAVSVHPVTKSYDTQP